MRTIRFDSSTCAINLDLVEVVETEHGVKDFGMGNREVVYIHFYMRSGTVHTWEFKDYEKFKVAYRWVHVKMEIHTASGELPFPEVDSSSSAPPPPEPPKPPGIRYVRDGHPPRTEE